MKYGYFDDDNREYVIERVDLPTSWTNYLGVKDMCAVVNHTAGGYLFYKSPEYHRITRFRANSIPMDWPGHYVYVRDDETGDYFSISWQPVGKSLEEAEQIRNTHIAEYLAHDTHLDIASVWSTPAPRRRCRRAPSATDCAAGPAGFLL